MAALFVVDDVRNVLFIIVCTVGLVLGCAHTDFVAGHGDPGPFMLKRIIAYGGRPVATGNLPALGGDWKYIQDKYGVGLVFPASQYTEVESFLTGALGAKPNKDGWAVPEVGATVFLKKTDKHTLVGIHPPILERKQ